MVLRSGDRQEVVQVEREGCWEGLCFTHLLGGESPLRHQRAGRGPAASLLPSPPKQEGEGEDKGKLMYFHAVASTRSPAVPAHRGREAAPGWADPARKQTLRYCSKWKWSQEAWSL